MISLRTSDIVAEILTLAVQEAPQDTHDVSMIMTVRLLNGATATIALQTAALDKLCHALIACSPRLPGTPGRN